MSATHQHLGSAIKARREELGITQEQLCERLGWQKARISELSLIESGARADLKFSRLELIAGALSLSAAGLVNSLSTKEAV